jgi:hypothetical protein
MPCKPKPSLCTPVGADPNTGFADPPLRNEPGLLQREERAATQASFD